MMVNTGVYLQNTCWIIGTYQRHFPQSLTASNGPDVTRVPSFRLKCKWIHDTVVWRKDIFWKTVHVHKLPKCFSHRNGWQSPVESAAMEAVPRMPMIWLDLKEAGEFQFSPSVRQVSWVENGATGLRLKVNSTGIRGGWISAPRSYR